MIHPAAAPLSYLRQRARLAHLDGNGVLVNHLAAIAFEQIKKPVVSGSPPLPVTAWSWSVVFALYWLTDSYMLREVDEVLKKVTGATDRERETIQVLQAYDWLVRQPLDSECEEQRSVLLKAEFKWADERDAVEIDLLLTHIAELIWYRGPTESHLAKLIQSWRPRVPAQIEKRLSALKRRFEVQTSMVILGAPRESDLSIDPEWDTFPWLPQIWRRVFDCDFKGIDSILAEQSPRHSHTPLIARIIFDLRHQNRLRGVFGDPQAIGLTRRRLLTAQSAELMFEDIRQERSANIVADLRLSSGSASDRFFGCTLSMLLELAALRRWDLSSWREAIEIQSRLYAEFAERESKELNFAAMAISGAVAAFHLDHKETWVEPTLARLEFLPRTTLAKLVSEVLNANPVQYHHAKRVFAKLGDAIPPEYFGDLARWALRYVDHSTHVDKFGMSIEKIDFLTPILAELPLDHEAWALLWPTMESLFRTPILWQASSSGLLQRTIQHAPAWLAKKALEIMLAGTGGDGDTRGRWRLLCEVCETRPEVATGLAASIIAAAPTPEDTLCLSEFEWAKPYLTSTNDAARLRAHNHLEHVLEKAILAEGKTQFEPSFGGWELMLRIRWSDSDIPWLERLISVIDHPRVLRDNIAVLVQYLRAMIEHGPDTFAERSAPRIVAWLAAPPFGLDPIGDSAGAFSVFRYFSGSTTDIVEQLTYLAAAARRKLGTRLDGELYQHLIRIAAQPPAGITGPAVLLTLELAADNESRRAELFTVCQALLLAAQLRAQNGSDAAEELMDGFRAPTWFAGARDRPSPASREFLLEMSQKIEALVAAVAASSTPRVRGQVAALLAALKLKGALTNQLSAVLANLSQDPRASVRRFASGG